VAKAIDLHFKACNGEQKGAYLNSPSFLTSLSPAVFAIFPEKIVLNNILWNRVNLTRRGFLSNNLARIRKKIDVGR
jgi:hypothetical protein